MDANRRIGVTGWRGRLGSELVRRGCFPLKCDVTDPVWIRQLLSVHRPDVVIHCAAMTDVDGCEERPKLATTVNAMGTHLLCILFKGPIVYLSTDYIFDGLAGPYAETTRPNPLGWYGWSKLGGELAVRRRGDERDLIVRTTVLFDRGSQNFVTSVAYRLIKGETLQLPTGLIGSPTYVPHLAAGILDAVTKRVGGTLNLAGARVESRYETGKHVAGALGLNENRIQPGPITGAALRPRRAGLRVEKAYTLGVPVGDPLDGIKEVAAYALETVGAG